MLHKRIMLHSDCCNNVVFMRVAGLGVDCWWDCGKLIDNRKISFYVTLDIFIMLWMSGGWVYILYSTSFDTVRHSTWSSTAILLFDSETTIKIISHTKSKFPIRISLKITIVISSLKPTTHTKNTWGVLITLNTQQNTNH